MQLSKILATGALDLATAALATAYGRPAVAAGPVCRTAQFDGPQVRIVFRHAGRGLVLRDGQASGFALAGADRLFHWAAGTPAVASDIPGYRAVVEQAGGGILFRRGDSRDLARSLVEVLSDDTMRDDLAGRGLEGVCRFAWPVVADRVLEVYGA